MKKDRVVFRKKAVVLLSGGLDSATTLYFARKSGFECTCLSFDYGQRHKRELSAAGKLAAVSNCEHHIVKIGLPWKGSSLLDSDIALPMAGNSSGKKIPNTYVPARNIIFLSFALSCAEAIGAEAIFIGANAVDYSGYPDCRPDFYRAFCKAIRTGTKSGVEGAQIRILTPLISKTKAQIVKLGAALGVPFGLTWSCYAGGVKPCGKCESCFYRSKGFRQARVIDPLVCEGSR